MINKNRKVLQQFTIVLILLTQIIFVNSIPDFCVINKAHDVIPLVPSQTNQITLGDYVRGYNIKIQTDNPAVSNAWSPVQFIARQTFSFDLGQLINVDSLESSDKKWYGQGIMFMQKDSSTVGIVYSRFSGAKTLASYTKFKSYQLPQKSNCFSGQIVDQDYNVVIDCQTIDGNSDIVCYTNPQLQTLVCSQIDSLNQVHDRKSQILSVGSQKFLITGTYSKQKQTKDMTYLTIYHIDTDQQFIDFVNIIDGYQLGLGYDIVVSDFDIMNNGNILINDLKLSQILIVKYSLPNQISLVQKPWIYGSQGQQIEVTDVNTLLIASYSNIDQFDLPSKVKVFHYEIQKTDNEILNIAANTYGLIVESSKGNLYVYQRIMSPVNYILGKMSISNKDYLLAPYSNVVYIFDQHTHQIYEFSSGYLSLQKIQQNINITVKAKSTTLQCTFKIQLLSIKDVDLKKIILKQNLTTKHFKTQTDATVSLYLQQIYSGQSLKYEIPDSTDELKYNLQHMSEYKLNSSLQNATLSQVVTYNSSMFLLLGLTNENVYVEMCSNDDASMQINCGIVYQSKLLSSNPTLLAGKQRKNGQIVFTWTYLGERFQTLTYQKDKWSPMFVMQGNGYDYSSITISQDKIYYVLKKYGLVKALVNVNGYFKIYEVNSKNFKSFTPQLTGFYPRQLYLHSRNSQWFYVKFPMHVCLMTMESTLPITIQCTQVLQKIIPDQSWTIVFGSQSYLVFTPDGITQYSIIGMLPTKLHDVYLDSSYTFPIHYAPQTNTAIFKTVDNRIIYYKLSKPSIDSIHYTADQPSYFSTQGYWTTSISNAKAYRQSYTTKLTIQTQSTNFKENLHFSIKVSSLGDQIQTDNNITIINYPTKINDNQKQNDLFSLPSQSSNSKIKLNMTKYFDGPKASYQLICDLCDGKNISLQTMFTSPILNEMIIGAKSIIQVFDNHVIILTNNMINLVDNKNERVTYKVIQNVKQCSQMGWHQKVGLLVFCQDTTGQQILLFQVNVQNITQKSVYQLHQGSSINVVNQILLTPANQNQVYVLIQDNDISDLNQKLTKHSTVKVFSLKADALEFKATLTSQSFGLDLIQPINDIDIQNNMIVATIGNVGFGYATLSDKPEVNNVLVNPQIINFESIDQLEDYTLDDSIFQQIQIIKYYHFSKGLQILITSTTSLQMVVAFTIDQNGTLVFNVLAQIYNRYGMLKSLNWQFITEKFVLLAYYNQDTQEQNIAYYLRPVNATKNILNFIQVYKLKIPQKLLLEHSIYLTQQNLLYISDTGSSQYLNAETGLQSMTADGKVTMLNVSSTGQFNMVLNYTTPGNFSEIKIATTNLYSSSWTKIQVKFPDNDVESDGIKWYTIMIIVLIVLAVVGVGYGMYLKMIKNRKNKTVSLLTEGEADEIV